MATIKITGLNEAIVNLSKVGDRVSRLGEGQIGRDILLACAADVDQRFGAAPPVAQGGAVWGGQTWPAVSPEYLNRNPRRVGGQLLRDTGELQQSYGLGGTGNIALQRPDMIVFGSTLPKARGLGKRRPQVFIHPALAETVANIIELHIAGGFDG